MGSFRHMSISAVVAGSLGLTLVWGCFLPSVTATELGRVASAASRRREPARLMLHDMMGGIQPTPRFIADNIAWIERDREFIDGLFVRLPRASFAVMKNSPLDYRT